MEALQIIITPATCNGVRRYDYALMTSDEQLLDRQSGYTTSRDARKAATLRANALMSRFASL